MQYQLITICTKKKISKRADGEIWDAIIKALGDNLETAGGLPISQIKYLDIWSVAHG